jgi:hypothetical protein
MIAHEGDHYARLESLCKREHWTFSVDYSNGWFALLVNTPEKVHHRAFRSGHENEAARELLHRLREVAA